MRNRCARRPATYAVKPSSRVPPKCLLRIRCTDGCSTPSDGAEPGSVGRSARIGRQESWLDAGRLRRLRHRPLGEAAGTTSAAGAVLEPAARPEPAHPAVPAVAVGRGVDAEAAQAAEDHPGEGDRDDRPQPERRGSRSGEFRSWRLTMSPGADLCRTCGWDLRSLGARSSLLTGNTQAAGAGWGHELSSDCRPDPRRRLPAARPRRGRRGEHRRADLDGAALRGLAGADGAHRALRGERRPRARARTPSCST